MKRLAITLFSGMAVLSFGIAFAQGQKPNQLPPKSAPPAGQPANHPTAPPANSFPPPPQPTGGAAPGPNGLNAQPPPASPNEPTELFQNPEGYTYDPTGRRDPFRPYGESQLAQTSEVRPTNGGEAAAPTPASPLEAYDVSQFKLIGIIWEVKDPKAMVKDPSGKIHLIRRQTRIGRNQGFVAAVREGEVIVVEPTIGENGMQSAITRSLNLVR